MTPETTGLSKATGHQITVRTRRGDMRVAAVWQVLMPVADAVEHVRITTSRERDVEHITIAFADRFSGSLHTVLRQFETMSWVAAAELC
ncbi:hypothetical protein BJG93_28680 (plasmid) [Paraburkholderia sprentiae WSM5005]|uniref:Uncharacterized protein n=1 Tax=Paraburkholderia sprentiae WSM5005 TaxID=754502 RepID=A0A1I9YTE1_9BURK|nr:hypothetical protein [Paraburkholderia sprentiae]APA89480.1 hypothetical protein BJG93_28680 [Paraburkholderia sprentiae WSM5005]